MKVPTPKEDETTESFYTSNRHLSWVVWFVVGVPSYRPDTTWDLQLLVRKESPTLSSQSIKFTVPEI